MELVVWGVDRDVPSSRCVRVLKDLPWVKRIVSPAGTPIGSTASCVALTKSILAEPQGSHR